MTLAAILLAAGRGSRAGGEKPKQWQHLAGHPVAAHSLAVFRARPEFTRIMLVIHPGDRPEAEAIARGADIVAGGATRAQSVRNALEALEGHGVSRVLIHDAARPCLTDELITRLVLALDHGPAAAPALAVTDALWRGKSGKVTGVQPREGLFRAQTPQAFHFTSILAAHRTHCGDASDDVEVARAAGLDVAIVEGEEENLKLTWPGDFTRAERILEVRGWKSG
ncbi:MAG: 2-C-methyl-D-erythritol 4-phosphate cytidylyltransferase [Pseudorhodobacter sp.]